MGPALHPSWGMPVHQDGAGHCLALPLLPPIGAERDGCGAGSASPICWEHLVMNGDLREVRLTGGAQCVPAAMSDVREVCAYAVTSGLARDLSFKSPVLWRWDGAEAGRFRVGANQVSYSKSPLYYLIDCDKLLLGEELLLFTSLLLFRFEVSKI